MSRAVWPPEAKIKARCNHARISWFFAPNFFPMIDRNILKAPTMLIIIYFMINVAILKGLASRGQNLKII